jgi:hypothetical protein
VVVSALLSWSLRQPGTSCPRATQRPQTDARQSIHRPSGQDAPEPPQRTYYVTSMARDVVAIRLEPNPGFGNSDAPPPGAECAWDPAKRAGRPSPLRARATGISPKRKAALTARTVPRLAISLKRFGLTADGIGWTRESHRRLTVHAPTGMSTALSAPCEVR